MSHISSQDLLDDDLLVNSERRGVPRTGMYAAIGNAIRLNREAILQDLVRLPVDRSYFAADGSQESDQAPLTHDLAMTLDYLSLYFSTRDGVYKDMFVSRHASAILVDATEESQFAHGRRVALAHFLIRRISESLRDHLSREAAELFRFELNSVCQTLCAPIRRAVDVLFFADCISKDVLACVTAAAMRDGICIRPTKLYQRSPVEQRNALRAMADRKFDAIFYSPFSYAFSPAYAHLQGWQSALLSRKAIAQINGELVAEIRATCELMSGLFDCNLFVHNSGNFRRHTRRAKDAALIGITYRTRNMARRLVNQQLDEYVAGHNARKGRPITVIDEASLLKRHGEWELGRRLYDASEDDSIGAAAKALSPDYQDYLYVAAHLLKRKVVICDLDNTLWEGVIGEGSVKHFESRQQILKRLRQAGVILTINSKNDPRSVNWTGCLLSQDDFVCAQINWNSKAGNVRSIQENLNLKTKDFVFIDDRADEREMVGAAFPEIQVMDATDARTWKLLDIWSRLLPPQSEMDRTEFYKQREARQEFISSLKEVEKDDGKLFATLGLRIMIRQGRQEDLGRAAELINRTNQFNMCGSRTSVREVTQWNQNPDMRVLVVDARDKFGDMGTVSVAILDRRNEALFIPVFVLSCRVFGYGIEDAVLNIAKGLAGEMGTGIVGLYKPTAHNEPCRNAYPRNGFTWDGSAWNLTNPARSADADWLTIRTEVKAFETGTVTA